MKLAYRILWIENELDSVEAAHQTLERRLAKQGFKLAVQWASTPESIDSEIERLKEYHEYDLIMVDYYLGATNTGDVMASRIRRYSKTEIIFYSSASLKELRKRIFEQEVDGVYIVDRQSIAEDTMEVINTTIKKVLDLNHMRGIMMSSVSDLDHTIADCITCYFENLNTSEQKELIDSIKQRIQESHSATASAIEKLETLEDIISSYQFSTSLRYNALQAVLKKQTDPNIRPLYELLKTYSKVIKLRNDLAHGRLIEQDQTFRLDGKTIELGEETFRKARVDLLKHQENFNRIYSFLTKISEKS